MPRPHLYHPPTYISPFPLYFFSIPPSQDLPLPHYLYFLTEIKSKPTTSTTLPPPLNPKSISPFFLFCLLSLDLTLFHIHRLIYFLSLLVVVMPEQSYLEETGVLSLIPAHGNQKKKRTQEV